MSINMKTLTQALAKTAAVIEKTVQTTVQEVTGPKPLQDYEILDQIGSAGPGLAWKLYSAKARDSTRPQQYPAVCVWLLDKRVLSEARSRMGLSKAAEDAFLDLIRADAAKLVRLRHPGVVHVVQALDESKNAMAMVTEPLFSSVANVLGNVENVGKVPKELESIEMSLLEVKHGLLQIAESLDFLHNNARLIHRAISPENVFITSTGAWKLGGFGFAISTDQSGDLTNVQAFHYAEYDVEDSLLPLQPSLNYTAPELVRSKATPAGCSSDVFSFGCLAYHLIARKPLFDCQNNVKMYMNTLNFLSSETFSAVPSELVPDLQRMLSTNESFRPTAMDFTGSPFFRNDTRLRALRFLDHMLERDNMQKSEFLKALSEMWKDFDSRVLRYKVLPPLCAELRNVVMQPMVLPMVLMIAESQDKNDFELITLPALVPVLGSASGDTLLLLVKRAELIINKASSENLVSHVLPMLVRAYSENDARIQEEVLKRSAAVAKQLDGQVVKRLILPRVHGLALKTTVAAVRVNALLCLGELVHTLDKHSVLEILQTIQRCTAVDRSAPTLMCTLAVANSILKQYGIEFTAEHVLPLLSPLLTAQQLNVQQFAKYMLFVKDVLSKIEEKRGVKVSESGTPELKQAALTNDIQSQTLSKVSGNVAAATKNSPAWDDDWGPINKGTPMFPSSGGAEIATSDPFDRYIPSGVQTQPSVIPTLSSQSTSSSSCNAVDFEWPPRQSLNTTRPMGDNDGLLNQVTPSDPSFNDLDPFANWPPRTGSSFSSSRSLSNGFAKPPMTNTSSNFGTGVFTSSGTQSDFNNSWVFNSSSSTLGTAKSSGRDTMPQNPLGYLKQSQGISSSGNLYNSQKPMDIGSIFSSSKNEQNAAPKLAPPPTVAVGRGIGRGRISGSNPRQSKAKPGTEQPPLLDLL